MTNFSVFVKNKKSYVQGEINSYRSDKMSLTLTITFIVGILFFIAGTILFIIYKKKDRDELSWLVIWVNIVCVAIFAAIIVERMQNNYVPLPVIIVSTVLMIIAGVFAGISLVEKIIELNEDY